MAERDNTYDIMERSPLLLELNKVLEKGKNNHFVDYEVKIHTREKDLTYANSKIRVKTLNIHRDFVKSVGDYIYIEISILFGDYIRDIYPYRENLEVTITEKNKVSSGVHERNSKNRTERYKAVFLYDQNTAVSHVSGAKEQLNQRGFITLRLELLDRSLEVLRTHTVKGNFNKAISTKDKDAKYTFDEFMRSITGKRSEEILIDGKKSIECLDIVQPDNIEGIKNLLIDSNTNILSLPTYIQEKGTGLYKAGIGTYVQKYKGKKSMFVYPTHDTNLFNKTTDRLVIYLIPAGIYATLPDTYREDSGTVYVMSESDNLVKDLAESDLMSEGSGFRKSDARSMMTKPVLVTPDGPVAVRAFINTEVVHKAREDNLDYAPNAMDKIGVNKFKEYSDINKKSGSNIQVVWRNSDISLIRPSMPVKIVTYDQKKRIEVFGVVLAVREECNSSGNDTILSDTGFTYSRSSVMEIYISSFPDKVK